MTDIDRRLRQVDHISPPDLWDQIEGRHPRQAPPPGARSKIVTVALALALAATGTFFAARAFMPGREATPRGWEGSDELKIPPLGEASAEFLADGRPVWVVHHEDGRVSVFDAFSTHRPWGVEELVGWCASSRSFQEREHGALFQEYGLWLHGPASEDLAFFETERTPGHIRVGARVEPETFSRPYIPEDLRHLTSQPPNLQGPLCYTEGMVPGPPPPQMHEFPESPTYASPAEAIEGQPDGWIKLDGVLLVQRDKPTYFCASVDGDSCTSAAEVEGIDRDWLDCCVDLTESGEEAETQGEDEWTRIAEEGEWIARVEGNRLTDLTRLETRIEVTEAPNTSPLRIVLVPDVILLGLRDAGAMLGESGLIYQVFREAGGSVVIRQRPKPGTQAVAGSVVSLTLGSAKGGSPGEDS